METGHTSPSVFLVDLTRLDARGVALWRDRSLTKCPIWKAQKDLNKPNRPSATVRQGAIGHFRSLIRAGELYGK
jgi:hypothetical protein